MRGPSKHFQHPLIIGIVLMISSPYAWMSEICEGWENEKQDILTVGAESRCAADRNTRLLYRVGAQNEFHGIHGTLIVAMGCPV